MNWTRLPDEKFDTGYAMSVERRYRPTDNQWPRLLISINDMASIRDGEEVRIFCSEQENRGSWWSKCDLPYMLMPDLIDMLHEFREKKDGAARSRAIEASQEEAEVPQQANDRR